MRLHAFTDETKGRTYLMAVALLPSPKLAFARQVIKSLVMGGQRRLHFHKEGNARRKQILDTMIALGVEALVYDASSYKTDKDARGACLVRMVSDLLALNAERLVLETEDDALKFDKSVIFAQLRAANHGDALQYAHMRAYEECLLALPDAIAWCWAKGGFWRAHVTEMVVDVRKV